ncbi:MAG: hypothetical protein JOZ38_01390 [Candidatus Eremiobacteraeota bacterium]|nr:hypothetical protein [Candidatus Eremiobacteraeota bacterium]
MLRSSYLGAHFAVAAMLISAAPVAAIPLFAHRYGVTCTVCHTVVPQLTPFGESFKAAGFRWPAKVAANPALPLSAKVNLAYTSAVDPSGLPKAIVDEVELLSMGPVGAHLDYRIEQYVVDGGVPGKTRDLYLEYLADPSAAWNRRPSAGAVGGQFTLPLPNDPETQRPTENHYAIFDQTVGGNSFDFFNDEDGIDAFAAARVVQLDVLALGQGDRMLSARIGPPTLNGQLYSYRGARTFGPVQDAFWRFGYALESLSGKARSSLLLQTGNDSSADGLGHAALSSGGFAQEEWAFNDRLIGVVRYDGTNEPGAFLRSTTVSLNYRPVPRVRLTLEGVAATSPSTSYTLNAAALFAY